MKRFNACQPGCKSGMLRRARHDNGGARYDNCSLIEI